MKKVLAVMLALVMAFSLCIPSFAETTVEAGGGLDFGAIIDTVTGIIGGFLPSDAQLPDLGGIIGSIGDIIGGIGGGTDTTSASGEEEITFENLSPEEAAQVVDMALNAGFTKAELEAAFDEMYATGRMDYESYQNLMAALEAAEEPSSSVLPDIDDADVAAAAAEVIKALKDMGVPADQLKSVVDSLYEQGAIPQNVYDEIIRQLDAAETTTDASNSGGIGGFLGGIIDAITGLFGGGDGGDGNGEGGNGTTTNPDSYEGKEPTGDTAILSVAAVAAVAGVALVLTKKKQK
ncbi:MAG: hypothetical protein Q4E21_06745 [Clostridia bacterium]|nr:hypothetical protein [Clostridia bacterium]